jgi:hypothetical protein
VLDLESTQAETGVIPPSKKILVAAKIAYPNSLEGESIEVQSPISHRQVCMHLPQFSISGHFLVWDSRKNP